MTIKITDELLQSNGWTIEETYAHITKDGWHAEYRFGRCDLSIWSEWREDGFNDVYSDVYVRVVERLWQFNSAFHLAGIPYMLISNRKIANLKKVLSELKEKKLIKSEDLI